MAGVRVPRRKEIQTRPLFSPIKKNEKNCKQENTSKRRNFYLP